MRRNAFTEARERFRRHAHRATTLHQLARAVGRRNWRREDDLFDPAAGDRGPQHGLVHRSQHRDAVDVAAAHAWTVIQKADDLPWRPVHAAEIANQALACIVRPDDESACAAAYRVMMPFVQLSDDHASATHDDDGRQPFL